MRSNVLAASLLLTVSTLFAACGGSNAPTNSSNSNAANNNATTGANTNNPLAVTTPTPEQTTNEAPTLAPVVRAYYDALKNKDSAAMKKVLSREFIARLEEDMRDENKKDLAAYMAETDKAPEKPVEVRNEKIQGDNDVAEIRGGVYPFWTPFAFIKEDGVWKFTGGSPALDSVSNSSK